MAEEPTGNTYRPNHMDKLRKYHYWRAIGLIILVFSAVFLLFYNLQLNPRPWHDEGAALTLAKTLAQDGVYAVKSSEGYQTFGPVQSVGPTVIFPIAGVFKIFGAGLIQGRWVTSSFALITLLVFFLSGLRLFGWTTAFISILILLGSPAASFLLYGRQVLGDIPALGFFLAGWLAWAEGLRLNKLWLYFLSGILLGAAMVTKSQYLLIGSATIGLLAILDLIYFKQKNYTKLLLVGAIAVTCIAAWYGWQYFNFGPDTFAENAEKLRQLASTTTGFYLPSTITALRGILGAGTGHYYLFWGFLSLFYIVVQSLSPKPESLSRAFLILFSILWLLYYTIWIVPWPPYLVAPSIIIALFVGKLFTDLLNGVLSGWPELWSDLLKLPANPPGLSAKSLTVLGTLVALVSFSLYTGYQVYNLVQADVIDRVGVEENIFRSARQFQAPGAVAEYLNRVAGNEVVIETWERELGILTDLDYHYPDQSLLTKTHAASYRGGPLDYQLGSQYFLNVNPDYLVEGWWARTFQIYDPEFLAEDATLIARIGEGNWRYDVYQISNH